MKTQTITVSCNCPICLLANVFGFAQACARDCDFCEDGVFDKAKYDDATVLEAEEIE